MKSRFRLIKEDFWKKTINTMTTKLHAYTLKRRLIYFPVLLKTKSIFYFQQTQGASERINQKGASDQQNVSSYKMLHPIFSACSINNLQITSIKVMSQSVLEMKPEHQAYIIMSKLVRLLIKTNLTCVIIYYLWGVHFGC